MLRIMRSRGRKMMMLRTFHKSTEIHRENAQAQGTTQTLCEPAQSKCTWTFHKSHFAREFTGKMPGPKTATQPLCEPAQSKRTRTFHKSHFIRKFAGKMPQTSWSALIKHWPLHLPQEPLVWTRCLGKHESKYKNNMHLGDEHLAIPDIV